MIFGLALFTLGRAWEFHASSTHTCFCGGLLPLLEPWWLSSQDNVLNRIQEFIKFRAF